jgi:hypothetical protein
MRFAMLEAFAGQAVVALENAHCTSTSRRETANCTRQCVNCRRHRIS